MAGGMVGEIKLEAAPVILVHHHREVVLAGKTAHHIKHPLDTQFVIAPVSRGPERNHNALGRLFMPVIFRLRGYRHRIKPLRLRRGRWRGSLPGAPQLLCRVDFLLRRQRLPDIGRRLVSVGRAHSVLFSRKQRALGWLH